MRRQGSSLGVFGGSTLGVNTLGASALGTCSRGNVELGDTTCLDAIYEYVRNQRPYVTKYPKLLPLITAFESWYQGLSWTDKNVMSNDTFDEAIRQRDAINAVMNEKLPTTWIPADVPQTAPPAPPPGGAPWPLWLKVALGFGAVGLVVYGMHEVRVFASLFKAPAKSH